MKTLADRLVKSPLRGDKAAADAADMLKRPARNHSDHFEPMVERFVFDEDATMAQALTYSPSDKELLYSSFRPPLSEFWCELGCVGFYVRSGWLTVFGYKDNPVYSLFAVRVEDIKDPNVQVHMSEFSEFAGSNGEGFGSAVTMFVILCALINSPRSATRERVHHKTAMTPSQRAFHRRRAQRGCPVYSFNKMTIKRPDTSLQRSDVILFDAPTSKRGHYVIGHWRLIDGSAEPYWTWVESHKRGDEALGFVAHERHIEIAPGSFGARRGFMIPTFCGQSGARIPAVRG